MVSLPTPHVGALALGQVLLLPVLLHRPPDRVTDAAFYVELLSLEVVVRAGGEAEVEDVLQVGGEGEGGVEGVGVAGKVLAEGANKLVGTEKSGNKIETQIGLT